MMLEQIFQKLGSLYTSSLLTSQFCFIFLCAYDMIKCKYKHIKQDYALNSESNKESFLCESNNFIISLQMYQLTEINSNKKQTLLAGQHDIIVHNKQRTCTDIVCLILFLLLAGAFIGLLIYGLVSGNPKKVFYVYNPNGVQCYLTQSYKYGFFPVESSISNATCVSQCPTSNKMTVSCLPDQSQCTNNNTITATYSTIQFDYFCVPSISIANEDITQKLNTNVLRAWALDLTVAWQILVGAAILSMVASMLFLCFVRCCTGIVIWITIFVSILGMQLIGILFILQAKGVDISSFIPQNTLTTLSYNSLIIFGSGLIVSGVLLALIAICLKSRIALGSKAVELGAMFLLQNCCIIILPITQAIFITGGLAAIIVGSVYLYSLGTFTFPDNYAFPIVNLNTQYIVFLTIYLAGGFWLVFFFHGCNHFITCSAVSIWYFNHESHHDLGAPFGDSIGRLLRYHPGSVAITSLVNGIFYIIKILGHILSFEAGENDHGLTLVCLKFLQCVFCIFKCFLRFLNDGTYVQIAVTGKSYCPSAFKAFNIVADNMTKISISDGISMFFTVLGVLGIGVGISVAAYFVCVQIQYFAKLLTNPLVVTIVSGLIAFVISGIYLSLIDLSAQSILQCYFIDHQFNNGNPKYARAQLKEVVMVQP